MAAMTTVGLVLGAGGLQAAAQHAGVLAALAEATGWDPRSADVVVGTSAGATTAASLRAGLSAADHRSHYLGDPLTADGQALVVYKPRIRTQNEHLSTRRFSLTLQLGCTASCVQRHPMRSV